MSVLPSPLPLPESLSRRIDAAAAEMLRPENQPEVCFSRPAGEAALVAADSVSWRVFKNPLSLMIGGMTAVILELAEPKVRSGVWDHSSFRSEPLERAKRTGLAAMVTVYGAQSQAREMIAGVVRRHDRVTGHTSAGAPYYANDPELLDWVQATASFGFAAAYDRYVSNLSPAAFDQLYAEAEPAARLYGAVGAPRSRADMQALFDRMMPRLERSDVVFEFLEIMRRVKALPIGGNRLQSLWVRAAVELVPASIRQRLGLGPELGLSPFQALVVKQSGAVADTVMIRSSPAVQACLRLGLPADYLYRHPHPSDGLALRT